MNAPFMIATATRIVECWRHRRAPTRKEAATRCKVPKPTKAAAKSHAASRGCSRHGNHHEHGHAGGRTDSGDAKCPARHRSQGSALLPPKGFADGPCGRGGEARDGHERGGQGDEGDEALTSHARRPQHACGDDGDDGRGDEGRGLIDQRPKAPPQRARAQRRLVAPGGGELRSRHCARSSPGLLAEPRSTPTAVRTWRRRPVEPRAGRAGGGLSPE